MDVDMLEMSLALFYLSSPDTQLLFFFFFSQSEYAEVVGTVVVVRTV